MKFGRLASFVNMFFEFIPEKSQIVARTDEPLRILEASKFRTLNEMFKVSSLKRIEIAPRLGSKCRKCRKDWITCLQHDFDQQILTSGILHGTARFTSVMHSVSTAVASCRHPPKPEQ